MTSFEPAGSCLKGAAVHHPKQTPSTDQSKEKFQKFDKTIFEILLKWYVIYIITIFPPSQQINFSMKARFILPKEKTPKIWTYVEGYIDLLPLKFD